MKLRSIALLLLLALGLRLGVGPHPCHAMKAAAQPASCHGAQHAPKTAPAPGEPGEKDCCKGGHALCEKGCQTAAVLQVDLSAPAGLAFQEQSSSPVDRSLPLFVLSIDHVPLA